MNADDFLNAVRDFIDFNKRQIGMYTDALSAFSHNRMVIEEQVARISVASGLKIDEAGRKVIMRTSLEDPSQPNVIHQRIIRAADYITENEKDGSHEQQHARAVILFLYTYWELEIRPRLALAAGLIPDEIECDTLGDLRQLRITILHHKGIMKDETYRKLKKLESMFEVGIPVLLSNERMHQIFIYIAQDSAALLFKHLGITDPPIDPKDIRDIAIQRGRVKP